MGGKEKRNIQKKKLGDDLEFSSASHLLNLFVGQQVGQV